MFPLCLLFSEKLSSGHTTEMENMKSLVHRLFTALHLEEFQKKREHHLLEKIDHLKGQLQPLEQVRKHHLLSLFVNNTQYLLVLLLHLSVFLNALHRLILSFNPHNEPLSLVLLPSSFFR